MNIITKEPPAVYEYKLHVHCTYKYWKLQHVEDGVHAYHVNTLNYLWSVISVYVNEGMKQEAAKYNVLFP